MGEALRAYRKDGAERGVPCPCPEQARTCNALIQVNRPPLPKLGSSWLAGAQRVNQPTKVSGSLRLAEEADNFEDCINNIEKAAKFCREYGLQLSPPPPPPEGGGQYGHQARMDAWRIVTTVILVLGVFAIVVWSLSPRNASAAAQYVAPISGLAGICLGWLFTNQLSSPSPKKQDPEP